MFSIRSALILTTFIGLSLTGCDSNADALNTTKDNADDVTSVPAVADLTKQSKTTNTKIVASESAQKNLDVKSLEPFTIEVGAKPLCGYKDSKKIVVVKPIYDACGEMVEGMAYVGVLAGELGDQYSVGYINHLGEVVIPVTNLVENDWNFDVRDFNEGLVAVRSGDKWGYLNKDGEVVIDHIYDSASDFSNGSAAVSLHEKGFGLISKTGAEITKLKYAEISKFSDGYALAKSESTGKYAVIDSKGKTYGKFSWDSALSFSEGLAAVATASNNELKWGFINQAGEIVIKPIYDMAMVDMGGDSVEGVGGFFKDGTADVYNQTPEAFSVITISKTGEELNKEYYDEMMDAFTN